MSTVRFDSRGVASLDGEWGFLAGDHDASSLDDARWGTIAVPGLWEAQGHLELDGAAWYRRHFSINDVSGFWTLRFGAVMDLAEVFVNGELVGSHDSPFTPFELDVTEHLVEGDNVVDVRVVDPPLGDPEHLRLPHGKQGWMNHVFPSRPSLYMTYGGIWQSVTLRRHGPVIVSSVFVSSDPDDLRVVVELESRSASAEPTTVGVHALGRVVDLTATVDPGGTATVTADLGATTAERWSIDSPVLHEVLVEASCSGRFSDLRTEHFGLRTVHVEGRDIVVNGEPYRMKSVLVQGFTADELYAEGPDDAIEAEVRAAKAMGFNTVRLHIKAFDPRYLDACDRIGIYVHSDLPVAEPINHEEMGLDSVLGRRCRTAITEQVRRDRNHPSVILWSAMNELCDGRHEARRWPEYETFARGLVAAVNEADGTRPVIENDWVEPDPDYVFASPILTAHWYGQLHADYFDKIERAARRWSGLGRPFYVSEFGDWGLPSMPDLTEPPFWDARAVYAAALSGTLWPATVGRFVAETQRYQGLSDRLQTEVWRRHDDIGGYCLTELTDVPQELNGLLDLHRQPKPLAVAEVRRANQPVLPMLELASLVAGAGAIVHANVHIANDGPSLDEVRLEVRFGDTARPRDLDELLAVDTSNLDPVALVDRFSESVTEVVVGRLPGHRATAFGTVSLTAPDVPGSHDLVIRLLASGGLVAENRYPIHVVDPDPADLAVQLLGGESSAAILGRVGVSVEGSSTTVVVGEGELDAATGRALAAALEQGATGVVLAQGADAAPHYPVPVALAPVATAWGSTVFRFTTDSGALPSLPRRNVLVAEDSTVQATTLVRSIDGLDFPDTPVVIAFKPVPGAMAGTIVGSHAVGPGRLVLCQYRLRGRVADGDTAACALLADVLRWAGRPRPTRTRRDTVKPDGRRVRSYSWSPEAAR